MTLLQGHQRGLGRDRDRRHRDGALGRSPTSAPDRPPRWPRSPPRCSACRWPNVIVYFGDRRLNPLAGTIIGDAARCTCPATRPSSRRGRARPAGGASGRRARRRRRARSSWHESRSGRRRCPTGRCTLRRLVRPAPPRASTATTWRSSARPSATARPGDRAGRGVSRLHLRRPRRRGGGRHRDRRGHGAEERRRPRRRPGHQPARGRGPDRGQRADGPGLSR